MAGQPQIVITQTAPTSDNLVTDAELAATTGAAMVGIADAGLYYTATTVEGALQEIQTDVSSAYVPYTGATTDVDLGTKNITTAKVTSVGTTTQAKIGYDSSNYMEIDVGSGGGVTLSATGIDESFIFKDLLRVDNLSYLGDFTNSDYTKVDSTGHQTMVGNARPWRDELGDAIALQQSGPGVSRNATESTVEYTTLANLSDFLYTNVQMNHDKDLSSSLYPHIHWFQENEFAPNFLLQYRWQINGGQKMTEWISLACNTTAFARTSGTSIHQICLTSGITATTNAGISDIVQFKVLRDNANDSGKFDGADPYGATAGVMSFDIHFQINSLGSTDEYTK